MKQNNLSDACNIILYPQNLQPFGSESPAGKRPFNYCEICGNNTKGGRRFSCHACNKVRI